MMASSSNYNDIVGLLQRAKDGDEQAKSELFENYRAYLTYVAQQSIGPELRRRYDPGDVVQEAYVAATRGFASFRGDSEPEFTDWLVKILQRQLVDALRYHKAQIRDPGRERDLRFTDQSAVVSWFEPIARESTPSQFTIRGEHALKLLNALQQLPTEQQSAVRMRYLEGQKLAAIASQLQRTPDAVVGLIRRGLAALRQGIGRELLS